MPNNSGDGGGGSRGRRAGGVGAGAHRAGGVGASAHRAGGVGSTPREGRRDGADDFLTAFDTFVQAVRRARGAPASGGDRELTLSQYGLLSGLANQRTASVRELAEHAGVTPSTATRILDALERRGVVRRRRTDADRRVVTITLTAAGRELVDEHDGWFTARQRAFHAGLPAAERRLAPDLLVRLAGLIEDLAAGP